MLVFARIIFLTRFVGIKVKVKVKESHYRPGQAPSVPAGWAPRVQDSQHMKVVRSALRTGRLYSPENTPGTHFC